MPEKVVLCGLGYVGLPVAMRAVEVGYDVVGYDPDESRVKQLAAGESYVEDVSSDTVADALATDRFTPTTDPTKCAGFDIAVITVPTPLTEGSPDLSYIESAAATLAAHLAPGATVILESTTYPGTTEELVVPILEGATELIAGRDFHVGYSPERIDPGNAMHSLVSTPKVVSGIDEESLAIVDAFYSRLVDTTVPGASTQVAELAKLLENTFRHVNIALVNELAMFANDLGIDIQEAIDAASTKPFGFMPFRPGPGVGGHCLPVDPSYLAWRVHRSLGQSFRFIELANDVNDHMPHYVVQRLIAAFNERKVAINGSRILLLGLAYKKNTSDARESPAVMVAERLIELGADVRAVDGLIHEASQAATIPIVDLSADEVRDADGVVLLTDHDGVDYDLVTREARYILDTRRRLAGPNVESL